MSTSSRSFTDLVLELCGAAARLHGPWTPRRNTKTPPLDAVLALFAKGVVLSRLQIGQPVGYNHNLA